MGDLKINRVDKAPYKTVASAGSEGKSFSSFQQDLNQQLKQDYRKRITELMDELSRESEDIFSNVNLPKFERYRILIKELLSEVLNNAFIMKSEMITDSLGSKRIMTVMNIIDSKLEEMASDLLSQNKVLIDYLGRVDEIRGLILDLFL
jgi:uncharacterized protein YaaR (DUF327 family)